MSKTLSTSALAKNRAISGKELFSQLEDKQMGLRLNPPVVKNTKEKTKLFRIK